MRRDRHRALFLDRTNSSRSQIAEALLRWAAGDAIDACSAGLEPQPIPSFTYLVLKEMGIEPGDLHPKSLRAFLSKIPVRWAIVLSEKTEADAPRLYPFAGETLYWPCPDPEAVMGSVAARLARFRTIRDQLHGRINAWLAAQVSAVLRTPPARSDEGAATTWTV
jgi:protein-tyrosine-phosphatase